MLKISFYFLYFNNLNKRSGSCFYYESLYCKFLKIIILQQAILEVLNIYIILDYSWAHF